MDIIAIHSWNSSCWIVLFTRIKWTTVHQVDGQPDVAAEKGHQELCAHLSLVTTKVAPVCCSGDSFNTKYLDLMALNGFEGIRDGYLHFSGSCHSFLTNHKVGLVWQRERGVCLQSSHHWCHQISAGWNLKSRHDSFDLKFGETHLFYILWHYQGSPAHCMVGVHLLSQLTCEMNQVFLDPMWKIRRKTNSFSYQISEADASRSLTKHRKIASSFRDSQVRCLILNRN